MKKQTKLEDYLKQIYQLYPEAFEQKNIKKLIWYVWENYDKVVFNSQLSSKGFLGATSPESITRARRAVIERLNIKSDEAIEKEQEYRQYYSRQGKPTVQQELKVSSQQDSLLKDCKDCKSKDTFHVDITGDYFCDSCYGKRTEQAKKLSNK